MSETPQEQSQQALLRESPHAPIWPWCDAGQDLVVFDGTGRLADGPEGMVRAVVGMKAGLRVQVSTAAAHWYELGPATLVLQHPAFGEVSILAHVLSSTGRAAVDNATLGGAPLARVIAHFTNLPWILPAIGLSQENSQWSGRWQARGGGWQLTLDVRPDHTKIAEQLRGTAASAVTHVGILERADGDAFDTASGETALAGWQLALSCAFGRWTAPAAPVGFDRDGRQVYQQWAAWRGDPVDGVQGWCDSHNGDGLAEFAGKFMDAWCSGTPEADVIRHLAHHIVSSHHPGTTMEGRIMLAQAGLEFHSWAFAVLGGRRSATKHRELNAETRVNELLEHAGLSPTIPASLTALTQFAAENGIAEAGTAIVRVRNRLTHPKDANEPYRIDNLLTDTWRLLVEYAQLMLLHRLDYGGSYLPLTRIGGFAHDRVPVPWAATGVGTTNGAE